MAKEKKQILLVEDDFNLGFVIQDLLKMEGYKVILAKDGKEGLQRFHEGAFDLCLLDVMLPKKDGFSLAEDIRKLNQEVPIVFLTAKGMIEDKVRGFKLGADDYITKPFENEEFLLRVKAILKRSATAEVEEPKHLFQFGKCSFNAQTFELEVDQTTQKLTRKEAALMKLLCENIDQVIEREIIANMVWGDDSYFVGRSMDVFITRLRKYLKGDPQVAITNVHGVGFRLELT